MSTLTRNPLRTPAVRGPVAPIPEEQPRHYRGRTVDELIPRIVAELGEDAIVIRHHRGLTGGFAGFFQRSFVEIEARRGDAGGQLLDRYDEDDPAPALPEEVDDRPALVQEWDEPGEAWATNPFAEALAEAEAAVRAAEPSVPPDLDAALAAALAEAEAAEVSVEDPPPPPPNPYAVPTDMLVAADVKVPIAPAPAAPPAALLQRGRTGDEVELARGEIEHTLLGVGIGEQFVHALIEGAIAHVLPLMPPTASLTLAVHAALTQRLPACPPLPAAGAVIALVGAGGSGKSACCAAMAEAYRAHGSLPATCTTIAVEPTHGEIEELARRRASEGALLLLDTPPLSPADQTSIAALAATLRQLRPDRVVLALPATLGAKPASQLLEALRPLGADALVITHTDATDQLGVAVQAACTFGLALTYLLDGSATEGLTLIDPADLVDRLLSVR